MAHWSETRLTELLGIRYPIIQAPMAGASSPALAAAVANGGGMGSLGCAMHPLDRLASECAELRAGTNGAYNINFFVHAEIDDESAENQAKGEAMRQMLAPYYDELGLGDVPAAKAPFAPFDDDQLQVMLEARPRVVSFHFELPKPEAVSALKDAGCLILASATNVTEARSLVGRGADAVVAQGFEAGGHRGTFSAPYEDGHVGTFALIPQIADAIDVPVIAAGGIMDGRGIAAALALGADGVQMGTAFISCPESVIPQVHRDLLLTARDDETRLTSAFSGRPARGIDNRYIRDLAGREDEFPEFPIPNTLTGALRKGSAEAGTGDFVSLWAGQGLTMSRPMPAAELLETLVRETDEVLGRLA